MAVLEAPATASLLRVRRPSSLRAAGPRPSSDAHAQALEDSAKAVVNLAREGVGPATAATWEFLVGTLRRLLGYAAARGYGHQPALELLFNGPLMMEYVAFMVVGRRVRRRYIGRGGGGRAPDARSPPGRASTRAPPRRRAAWRAWRSLHSLTCRRRSGWTVRRGWRVPAEGSRTSQLRVGGDPPSSRAR